MLTVLIQLCNCVKELFCMQYEEWRMPQKNNFLLIQSSLPLQTNLTTHYCGSLFSNAGFACYNTEAAKPLLRTHKSQGRIW